MGGGCHSSPGSLVFCKGSFPSRRSDLSLISEADVFHRILLKPGGGGEAQARPRASCALASARKHPMNAALTHESGGENRRLGGRRDELLDARAGERRGRAKRGSRAPSEKWSRWINQDQFRRHRAGEGRRGKRKVCVGRANERGKNSRGKICLGLFGF